jgi:hypothetical protein
MVPLCTQAAGGGDLYILNKMYTPNDASLLGIYPQETRLDPDRRGITPFDCEQSKVPNDKKTCKESPTVQSLLIHAYQ